MQQVYMQFGYAVLTDVENRNANFVVRSCEHNRLN
jgi:hypothetical protein